MLLPDTSRWQLMDNIVQRTKGCGSKYLVDWCIESEPSPSPTAALTIRVKNVQIDQMMWEASSHRVQRTKLINKRRGFPCQPLHELRAHIFRLVIHLVSKIHRLAWQAYAYEILLDKLSQSIGQHMHKADAAPIAM